MRFPLIACLVACASAPPPPPDPPRHSSPGPLAEGHATIDNQLGCNDCHVTGSAALAVEKCLACHAAIADRIVARGGLHGSAAFAKTACWDCHADHRGRRFDLRGWTALPGGERGFDHDRARWPLRSRHATARCEQCHPTTNAQGLRLYLGASRACIACHEKAEPHRTRLACERCHLETGWKPVKRVLDLDHPATLPLAGAHAKVACVKCHTDGTFALQLGTCAMCHVDPHVYPSDAFDWINCKRCHAETVKTFREISFDHAEATRVSLGPHKKLRCAECHNSREKVTACVDCHAGVQPTGRSVSHHGNRFAGLTCQRCHTPVAWRNGARFDHRATKFQLRMKHTEIGCRACHRGSNPATFEDLSTQATCTGCHAHAKVHDHKYGEQDCLKCHYGF